MVKSKKSSKKPKTEEPMDVEAAAENSTDVKTEEESDKATQENGEVDAGSKKKAKGKPAKKEEAVSEDEAKDDDASVQENGDEVVEKKKPAGKKAKPAKKTDTKPASEPSRKSTRTPKPVAKETSDDGYEVEDLLEYRLHRGKPQYLVRWKGYAKADDTWEDESGLNCPDLLQKFKDEHPNAGKKAKKRGSSKSPAKTAKKSKTEKTPKDYEVEEIVGLRVKNGKKEFKIRWKGYKPSDDSWEPEKHLSCQDLIQEYLEAHKEEVEEEENKAKEKQSPKKDKTPAKSGRKTRAK